MNTASNVMLESAPGTQGIPPSPPAIPATRRMYWSVRRELWENRSIYLAPLVVAGVFLFGFLISTIHLPDKMRAALAQKQLHGQNILEQPYNVAALVIMGTVFIVGFFYTLDALQGERRDRSILFWKSLPVSDLTTVLSKASIPIVILPLLSFVITVATQLIMLLLSTAVLAASGRSVSLLWAHLPLFHMSLLLLYHLLAVHGLWYAPIYGWLLLVSAWARRAAVLWAALPLLAIGAVEKIVFNTSHFAAMLQNRMSGGAEGAAVTAGSASMDSMMMHINPGHFLFSPGMLAGLAFAGLCVAAAARLRRNRDPN